MKILNTLLLITFSLSLPQLIKPKFKLPPAHSKIAFRKEWEALPANDEIKSILNQNFSYLAHGNQVSVFKSDDGKYVLKLFKFTRSQFKIVEKIKAIFAKLHNKKPKNDFLTKINKTFTAACMACNEGQKFTQVLYCHLNLTTNELPRIKLKAHKTYILPLDRARFVVQKIATPFKTAMLEAKNDPAKMHRLIDSFLVLIKERSDMEIRNSDPNLLPNFGFIEERAVEIDFGNYRKGRQSESEIQNYFLRLEKFLKNTAPEYVEYLRRNHDA